MNEELIEIIRESSIPLDGTIDTNYRSIHAPSLAKSLTEAGYIKVGLRNPNKKRLEPVIASETEANKGEGLEEQRTHSREPQVVDQPSPSLQPIDKQGRKELKGLLRCEDGAFEGFRQRNWSFGALLDVIVNVVASKFGVEKADWEEERFVRETKDPWGKPSEGDYNLVRELCLFLPEKFANKQVLLKVFIKEEK